ncbi:XRE family transcriptional regulator [Marinovum sp. 2_MG-2023]|uniref:helix-turn-helix domain-containing protein n=1 Tax=unclassified Marinovum TaxID=2647166 RepID=UPI0026E39E32|nr:MULTISPECIES: XRE family transcriptional regulator [unclassified Marinovum]MDO6730662.1 XRE family transcriptional regulator [Marinovum sp. 2_MG-2023]MDO6778813.1 XRE family transcriptional regulator [Marinovum sp. 1_MG-2023]
MTETSDDILALLPARLKEARRTQGLSLDAVAKLSGVSRSMVSQIERGESSPTIATLWNLTRALQVDFAGLLEEEVQTNRIEVLRADQIPTIDNMGAGCRIRIFSPPEEAGRNELYELLFDAGGRLDSQAHKRGTVETLSVISGRLEVTSGEAIARLEPGDSARYAADLPHRIRALDGDAKAFLIVQDSG